MSIFPAFLMVHLVALVLMVGTSVVDFFSFQTFWKLFKDKKEQAAGILVATARFAKLISTGAGLLILTGLSMIALTHGLLAEQLWFKIKIIIVLLLIINGIGNGTRLSVKVRKVFANNDWDVVDELLILKSKMRIYYLVQFSLFLIVIFLSAYKFN